jgi:hypothetical protein
MSAPDDFLIKVPDSVAADPEAVELLRMWWSKDEPVMSIKPAFNDPARFGHMLVVAARHMAHGYAVRHGQDEKQAYNRILEGMSEAIKANNVRTAAEPDASNGSVQ